MSSPSIDISLSTCCKGPVHTRCEELHSIANTGLQVEVVAPNNFRFVSSILFWLRNRLGLHVKTWWWSPDSRALEDEGQGQNIRLLSLYGRGHEITHIDTGTESVERLRVFGRCTIERRRGLMRAKRKMRASMGYHWPVLRAEDSPPGSRIVERQASSSPVNTPKATKQRCRNGEERYVVSI
jgi:hypothetical protein